VPPYLHYIPPSFFGQQQIFPRFRRIRKVHLDNDSRLHCSCNLFEICGFPCRHIAAVLMKSIPHWKGFTKLDRCVLWWRVYLSSNSSECYYGDLLRLSRNDITGPLWPSIFTDRMTLPIDETFKPEPDSLLLNYSTNDMELAMRTVSWHGFTQTNEDDSTNDLSSEVESDSELSNIFQSVPDVAQRDDGAYQILKGFFGDLCIRKM
jgi:hypothetical protein